MRGKAKGENGVFNFLSMVLAQVDAFRTAVKVRKWVPPAPENARKKI
jgi:hypothetical protein